MELKYLFLLGLVFILYSVSVWASGREGFESGESLFVEDPFDATYASIYNALWNPEDKMKYERVSIQEMALADWPISNVNILDLSCKTAANACWFVQFGVKYTGVDASEDMISQARIAHPQHSKRETLQTQNCLRQRHSVTSLCLTFLRIASRMPNCFLIMPTCGHNLVDTLWFTW